MSSMASAATDYVAMQSSKETRRAYERDLGKWFEVFAGAEMPGRDSALQFKRMLEEHLSPASAARAWSTVRGFYRFALPGTASPFEFIKGPKRTTNVTPKVPTDEDVNALLAEARQDVRQHMLVALLLNGLRAGEAAAMKVSDVESHDVDGRVSIVLRVTGKGNKQRLVPANFEALNAIGRHEGDSEWLAHDYNGARLTVRQVEESVYRAAKAAGIEGMHPHALRHHYATRLIRAGAGWGHVQQLLGHANVATTMVYVTLDIKDLTEAARLDPMDKRAIENVKEALSA